MKKNFTRVPAPGVSPATLPPPQAAPPQRNPAEEAVHMLSNDVVPPMECPCCRRGMQPLVLRRRTTGDRDCQCKLCGREFVYKPATIRVK